VINNLQQKRAPDYLAKWQERRKELKQKRINRMKEKELEKFKKDAQHLQNKQYVNLTYAQDSFWHSMVLDELDYQAYKKQIKFIF
jgi:hypothetical protein